MDIPVFIVAGQSNAVGASTSVHELPRGSPLRRAQSNVLFWGPTFDTPLASKTWNALVPPTEISQTVTGPRSGAGFGPELAAAGELSRTLHPGQAMAFIKHAVNNTNLYEDWAFPEGPQFIALITQVRAALSALPAATGGGSPRLTGLFWMQGESDTASTTAAFYQTNLVGFIAGLRATLGVPDLPVILGQIDHAAEATDSVRQAQVNVAATVANAALAPTDDLVRSRYRNDLIHFGTEGMVQLGERFAHTHRNLTQTAPRVGRLGSAAATPSLIRETNA